MSDPRTTPRGDRTRRIAVAGAMLVLFALSAVIFVLPFAFPTPPPIITRFHATRLFSPNGDGQRELARINVRVHDPSRVELEIQRDGTTVVRLLDDQRQPGWVQVSWDGRDQGGAKVPDGSYSIKLLATSGRKRFDVSRAVEVDTDPPASGPLEVASAGLGAKPPAQCQISLKAVDAGSATLQIAPAGGDGSPLARLGPRPVEAGAAAAWSWRGQAGGERVPSGLYVVSGELQDAALNGVRRQATCWVGQLTGSIEPARPAAGETVRVSLRDPDGRPVAPQAQVLVALYRLAAIPGRDPGRPAGARLPGGYRGPLGHATVTLPPDAAPGSLWLLARTLERDGAALIPLGPVP